METPQHPQHPMQGQPNYPPHPPGLPPAAGWPVHPAMVVTGVEVPNFRVARAIGVVRGLTVRSPGIAGGFSAAFQSLGGGNVSALVDVCERARGEAYYLMLQHAAQMGANAVIGFRYDATEMGQSLTEVLAYGTAVWAEPAGEGR